MAESDSASFSGGWSLSSSSLPPLHCQQQLKQQAHLLWLLAAGMLLPSFEGWESCADQRVIVSELLQAAAENRGKEMLLVCAQPRRHLWK